MESLALEDATVDSAVTALPRKQNTWPYAPRRGRYMNIEATVRTDRRQDSKQRRAKPEYKGCYHDKVARKYPPKLINSDTKAGCYRGQSRFNEFIQTTI
jgi:hypothetical protein